MSVLRKSARGQPCTVRIPYVCNYNLETTVLAHVNGAGVALKEEDIHACFACSNCHSWLDGGWVNDEFLNKDFARELRDLAHLQAVVKTQKYWRKKGLIRIGCE